MLAYNRKLFYYLLSFFLIFAFPISLMLSSAKLVVLYVFVLMLLCKSVQKNVSLFLKSFAKFPCIYYFVFIYTFGITLFLMANEWTLTGKVISSFILYFVSFCFFCHASQYVEVHKVVVYVFVAQSILIILSIFSEQFFNLMEPFRKVDEEKDLLYGRLRGNAISGYQFFGISTMYSFVVPYLILHLKQFKYGFCCLLLLFIAAIVCGRFSIVSVFIGLAILLWKKINERKIGKVVWILLGTVAVVVLFVLLLYSYVDKITDPLMYKVVSNYIIAPIDSILAGGAFESSSTNELIYMYEKDDIKKYFVWGSGIFQLDNGHYFGGVDIGYYRMLGYYGILGFLLITYAFFYLIYRTKSSLDIYTKHAFFLIFLALNFKGVTQVFDNNIVPILVAFLFFASSDCKKQLKFY